MKRILKKAAIWVGLTIAVLIVFSHIRRYTFFTLAEPTDAMIAQAGRVEIIRDEFGVPHIFGETDADAAFGLAYAHAEDDFGMIQGVIAASIGKLSLLMLNEQALGNDFYVRLIRVNKQVKEQYGNLSPEMRAVLEGYAAGLSYYAALHRDEADGRLFPVKGEDLAAGFIHKVPLMFELPVLLGLLDAGEIKNIGDVLPTKRNDHSEAGSGSNSFALTGSNTHALHRFRSDDNVTRLNINSHQPWEGPVTWYEAHISSNEGWNMLGGTFPGAPFILHGHNDYLGWAHTVNYPDLVDVYKLNVNESGTQYEFGGEWRSFSVTESSIEVDIGIADIPIAMDFNYSPDHGPVLKTGHGYFAIRYAGMNRSILAAEQWYRMNKATNLTEWQSAMAIGGIPMFNTGYADVNNIYYVFNGLLPIRKPGEDYKKVLDGTRPDLVWSEYLPYTKLPQVLNPPSGFIQNCNTTPFKTTTGPGNPDPSGYDKSFGIDTADNNRAMRSRRFLSRPGSISRASFLEMKYDRMYAEDAPIMKELVEPILKDFVAVNPSEEEALEILKRWNRSTHPRSTGATLAVLSWHPFKSLTIKKKRKLTPGQAFRETVSFLSDEFGRVSVELGEVQRLRRGDVDLPLGGGFNVIAAIDSKWQDQRLIGFQGDSYINIAEFSTSGVRSFSRHQYGNSNRPTSKHYTDQVQGFLDFTLKEVFRDKKALLEREHLRYNPGKGNYNGRP